MVRKDIPKNLKNLQMSKRLETVKKIQEAIDDIHEEGGIVTKKKLMELTGLANSTFSKPHVLDVLKVNKVCQFKVSQRVKVDKKQDLTDQLYKKIDKLEQEKKLLQSKLQDKDIFLHQKQKEHQELNEKYMLILGKLHTLMKKVEIHGIDIGKDFDNL